MRLHLIADVQLDFFFASVQQTFNSIRTSSTRQSGIVSVFSVLLRGNETKGINSEAATLDSTIRVVLFRYLYHAVVLWHFKHFVRPYTLFRNAFQMNPGCILQVSFLHLELLLIKL